MKIALLILLIPLTQSCSKSSDVRGYTIIDDMVHSPAYEAFSENSLTPDGKTMMMPVKGSIARGKMPHPYSDSEADAIKPGSCLHQDEPALERRQGPQSEREFPETE